MSVAQLSTEDNNQESKKAKKGASPVLGFSDEDKIETIQPRDDALVVTVRIGGFDVKKVLVDQGSAVEVMYADLYRGLNLKPEKPNSVRLPFGKFRGEDRYSKGPDQTAHTDRFRRGGGGFHCSRRLFTLHSYCG